MRKRELSTTQNIIRLQTRDLLLVASSLSSKSVETTGVGNFKVNLRTLMLYIKKGELKHWRMWSQRKQTCMPGQFFLQIK